MPRLRSSEIFALFYFAYVAIISPIFINEWWKPWLLLAAIAAVAVWVARIDRLWSEHLRDWLPLAATLAAYREMDRFTRGANHALENAFLRWDRWLLDDLHVRAAIESLGWLLPAYFELCYLLVYAVAAVAIASLLWNGKRVHADRLWLAYFAGTLGAYALFPYFPSEPPRTAFAGTDLPHVMTAIRRLNLFIVGGYGIHSSVFPSAHVSSALSAAWGLLATLDTKRWIGWAMAFYGLSVAVASVYGRYHYAADAVAGIGMSLLAFPALRLLENSRRGTSRPKAS